MFKWLLALPSFVVIISIFLNFFLVFVLTTTYKTLTKESVVAILEFKKVEHKDKVFIAKVFSESNVSIGEYEIYGDQWRIDAKFIKMKYLASIIGMDSRYALNRIEGRYSDINEQNTKMKKSYLLQDNTILDIFSIFIDTTYGSSTYKDIKLNTRYFVIKSQTGLLVRELDLNKSFNLLDKIKSFF